MNRLAVKLWLTSKRDNSGKGIQKWNMKHYSAPSLTARLLTDLWVGLDGLCESL